MNTLVSDGEMAAFLAEAKRRTYAGLDDAATISNPAFSGSKQLEWRQGDWAYRDVYFGTSFFTGLEVVCFRGKPVWSTSYCGGVPAGVSGPEAAPIYAFLRLALMQVPLEFPIRGPHRFSKDGHIYEMKITGDLRRFHGREKVSDNGTVRYALTFAGGVIL